MGKLCFSIDYGAVNSTAYFTVGLVILCKSPFLVGGGGEKGLRELIVIKNTN